MKKFIILGILLGFFLPNPSRAQQLKWVVDTVYTKIYEVKDFLILSNSENCIVVRGEEITLLPVSITASIQAAPREELFVEVDNKPYLWSDALSLTPLQGLGLDIDNIHSIEREGDHIAYKEKNDSIFVADLRTMEKTFVMKRGFIIFDNARYLIIRRHGSPQEDYFYDIEADKLSKLPEAFSYNTARNESLIIGYKYSGIGDPQLHVKDLELKDVILPAQNYTDFLANKNLAIFFGNRQPAIVFYQGKPMELPEEVVRVKGVFWSKCWVIENRYGKKGIMGPEGNILYTMANENVKHDFGGSGFLDIQNKGQCQLIGQDGQVVFSGPYDDANYLDDNRFAVLKGGKWSVVDKDQKVLIPFMGNRDAGFSLRKDYGRKFFCFSWNNERRFYDYDGHLIAEHTVHEGEDIFLSRTSLAGYNKNMIAGLSQEQARRVNKYDAWLYVGSTNQGREFRFERHDGTPASGWFSYVRLLPGDGLFWVWAKNKKAGVGRLEP